MKESYYKTKKVGMNAFTDEERIAWDNAVQNNFFSFERRCFICGTSLRMLLWEDGNPENKDGFLYTKIIYEIETKKPIAVHNMCLVNMDKNKFIEKI